MRRTGPRLWVPPRYGTPRDPSRESLGHQVAEVSRRLGTDPMPHQQHVWDVALEVEHDGRFVYDAVDLTIMRQSGKTKLVLAKKCWRLTVAPKLRKPDGKPWGRQRAIYTAQRRADARKKLEQDFAADLREARGSFKELTNPKARPSRATEWRLSLNNGQEHIQFGNGNYLQIDAPSPDAGHGDSLDDANIDEAWALENDDVEQGIQPTMATRWNAQQWTYSTAGDENSFYLWSKVRAGRAHSCTCGARFVDECSCGWKPTGGRTAYFEWSLPEDADIDDEDLWWEYMPALGWTISPEFIRSQLDKARRKPEEGGEDLWRRGYANQWTKVPLIGGETRLAKLPAEQWDDSRISFDETPPINPGEVAFAFDVTPTGTVSSIVAATGSQARPYVELVDRGHGDGTGWLPKRIVELVAEWKPRAVGFDQGGPAGALADVVREALKDVGGDPSVVKPLSTAEYKAACGALFLAVNEQRLRRADGQPPMDLAGHDATERRVGDGWVWDRRSATVPITPLVAATCAVALLAVPSKKKPKFAW